jgi:predicted neuraminidase
VKSLVIERVKNYFVTAKLKGVWRMVRLSLLLLAATVYGQIFEKTLLFPTEPWHNHSSSLVELANGDLLLAWYHGSGEGQADDVRILGMRKPANAQTWSEPFLLADTPNLPDLNPVLFVDQRGALWLFWATFQDNTAKGVLIKYRTSHDCLAAGAPKWDWQDVLHVRADEFEKTYLAVLDSVEIVRADHLRQNPKLRRITDKQREMVHDKLLRRLGWMIRTSPITLDNDRILLGLYHDEFSCSLAAFSDDRGVTWSFSRPMAEPFLGMVQPSFAERRDGTIVAYMRDNGYYKQIRISESNDLGATWSAPRASDIPNPGSSVQLLKLKNHNWLLCTNDLKKGRHRLTIFLSLDEGRTWTHRRVLHDLGENGGELSYPCLIQAKDGTLHLSYSFQTPLPGRERNESICYAHFDEAWVLERN